MFKLWCEWGTSQNPVSLNSLTNSVFSHVLVSASSSCGRVLFSRQREGVRLRDLRLQSFKT